MATKPKKPAAKPAASPTKVTRITATDTKKSDTNKTPAAVKATKTKQATVESNGILSKLASPFIGLGQYFRGAWFELRQVTWPNRKATWSLTAALLVFTSFFVVMILLLDAFFKYLFELILG